MAKVVTDDRHYTDIANELRDQLGSPDLSFTPRQMAGAIGTAFGRAYENGEIAGKAEGLSEGIVQGKQAEYDRFWDVFQQEGKRTDYRYAFAGWYGAPDIKYPITPAPTQASNMFQYFNIATPLADRPDLTELCEKLDLSGVTNVNYLFNNARAKNITVDLSSATTQGQRISQWI